MWEKLARLFQPRNPKFWMMMGLNALSTVLAWVARSFELAWPAAALVMIFAVGNGLLGMWLMFDLMKTPPPARV